MGPLLDLTRARRADRARRTRRPDRPARRRGQRAADRPRAAAALGSSRRVHARLRRDPAPERDTCAMRILVAEDETIIRLDLRDLLERAGFEVCAEARDGEEAVELARSELP